jgi:hypothetical protein
MDTPPNIASRIVAAVVNRFADDHGIAREHLTTAPDLLTPVEVARATSTLGSEVIFNA